MLKLYTIHDGTDFSSRCVDSLDCLDSLSLSSTMQSQNSTLVNIEQHYAAFNSHLDDLSVEKLLLEFVQAKSTGTDKPSELIRLNNFM